RLRYSRSAEKNPGCRAASASCRTARLRQVSRLKILILKPSSLGDIVLALPVLRLLKRHLPEAEIHWWIETTFAPLLADDPDLSSMVLFDRHRWQSPANWIEPFR